MLWDSPRPGWEASGPQFPNLYNGLHGPGGRPWPVAHPRPLFVTRREPVYILYPIQGQEGCSRPQGLDVGQLQTSPLHRHATPASMTTIPSPLPLLHLPITHAQLAPPASARMDAPAPATPGPPRMTTQPHSEGACVCVSQASWPRGTALTLFDPRQSRGSSGSSITLMEGDAWQACVLSLHQACCRGAGGGAGGALVPGTSLPLASCPHQALLSVQKVHAAPMPSGASDRPPHRPQFPHFCRWEPGALATLASFLGSRAGRRSGNCNSFLRRGLRVPGVRASVGHAHPTTRAQSVPLPPGCPGARGHPHWAGLGMGWLPGAGRAVGRNCSGWVSQHPPPATSQASPEGPWGSATEERGQPRDNWKWTHSSGRGGRTGTWEGVC